MAILRAFFLPSPFPARLAARLRPITMQLAIDFDESRFDRQLSVLSVKTGFKYCQTVMDAFREYVCNQTHCPTLGQ
jgi:hypothetical protein